MKKIQVWGADIPEPQLEPKDHDEPTELDDAQEAIQLNLDLYIKAEEDMIDFMAKTKSGLKGDLQWDWARGRRKDGSWASETYPSVTLCDQTSLVEYVGDLLIKLFDDKKVYDGYWHVVAQAKLVFDLYNIQEVDGEVDEDGINVDYSDKDSTLSVSFFGEVDKDGNSINSGAAKD